MQKMDEDPEFEKELGIRKSIMKEYVISYTLYCVLELIRSSFNKRREDFKTLREYNDYLEQAEDIS